MPCANVKRSDISTIRHSTRFHFLVLHNKVLWTFRALCSFGFVSRLLELGGDYVNGSKLLLQFTFFPVSLVNDNQVEWHTTRYHTPQHEPAQGRESHYAIIWQFFLCSVQFSSVAQLCLTLCNPMNHSMPGLPVHHQLPEFTQTHIHQVSDAIQPSHPLSSPFLLPPISPRIRVFSNESALHTKWPNYYSFSFNIIPSKEIPRLISFRMDWLDFLAVQGTLKSLLQHHSSKASILQGSVFFTVQLSHPYMTTGKTIALTRRILVSKVMSLLLNILSRLVITFLPRSKRLLISWPQSPSAVILEPRK